MRKKEKELWITNISTKKDVLIDDLGIRIRAGQSINLLAKKRNGSLIYNVNMDQIEKSIKEGSIFNKKDLKIRKFEPQKIKIIHAADSLATASFSSKNFSVNRRELTRLYRKGVEVEEQYYPDLEFDEGSQEDFAVENAELDFADRAPILAVDPKYKIKDDE